MAGYISLGYITYNEYLHAKWFLCLKRRLITNKKTAKCVICGRKNTLLLHHERYDRLGEEKANKDVFVVCFDCHTRIHWWWIFKLPLNRFILKKRRQLLQLKYAHRWLKLWRLILFMLG